MKKLVLLIPVTSCCLLLIASRGSARQQISDSFKRTNSPAFTNPSVQTDLGKMPLYFIPNKGQLDNQVAYYIQGKGKILYFTAEGITFALSKSPLDIESPSNRKRENWSSGIHEKSPAEVRTAGELWVVKLEFVGAERGVKPRGKFETGTVVSYFKKGQEEWQTGLQTYSRIVYPNLWPGIDLECYGAVDRIKYEIVVHPGADPSIIRLAYQGVNDVSVDENGRLQMETPVGNLIDDAPVAYQDVGNNKIEVPLAYQLNDVSISDLKSKIFSYGFKVGCYDRSQPLILDPAVFVYCGFIGGSGNDGGDGIAVDGSGNVYITGYTQSIETTFPATAGPDLTHNGNTDVFVAKVNASGTGLEYCGYIGGADNDYSFDVTVDQAGNAYITGATSSTEASFPVTVGPGLIHNGKSDIFVAKVNASGTGLEYCGYIGGDNEDRGLGIAVDGAGNAYVIGDTLSTETRLPVIVGPDLTYNGGYDVIVAKINSSGTGTAYCGYIGGNGNDWGDEIDIDNQGNAYVMGDACSTEATFPVAVGPDTGFNGGMADAFVAKVNAAGTGLEYCGYVGGNGNDWGFDIDVDNSGAAFVTGQTYSSQATFPAIVGPDLTHNGGADVFVAKVNAGGTGFDYCGYIGGSDSEEARSIAVDRSGNAYVTGYTLSTEASFPVKAGPDLTQNGGRDAFVAKINASGTGLIFCGYIGGFDYDYGYGIAVDESGNAYITGETASNEATFPAALGPDLSHNGSYDVFVAKVYYYWTPGPQTSVIGDFDGDSTNELACDLGANGAWMWDAGVWTQICTINPESIIAANVDGNMDDELFMDSSADGLWLWDNGTMSLMSGANVETMAAGDVDGDNSDELIVDFGSVGLWLWDSGVWSQLSGVNVESMVVANLSGSGGAEITGDFGTVGLWLWSGGTWTQLSGVNVENMTSGNTDGVGKEELVGDFGPVGLWVFSNNSWEQWSGVNADYMIAAEIDGNGDDEVFGDFGCIGLWLWDSGVWTILSGLDVEYMIALDADGDGGDEMAGDFAAIGIWLWDGGSWSQISNVDPENLIGGDIDGDSAGEIFADLGSLGLWLWNGGIWSQISAINPD